LVNRSADLPLNRQNDGQTEAKQHDGENDRIPNRKAHAEAQGSTLKT
jgi:hypothetical protein